MNALDVEIHRKLMAGSQAVGFIAALLATCQMPRHSILAAQAVINAWDGKSAPSTPAVPGDAA